MPGSKKSTLWFSLNLTIACLIEVAQYLKAIFEVTENPPVEIIQRLSQIIELLPASMNLADQKFTQEELQSAGLNTTPNGAIGLPEIQSPSLSS